MRLRIWLVALLAAVVGCSRNSDIEPYQPSAVEEKAAAAVAPGHKEFAFDFVRAALKGAPEANVCFSPLSLNHCLCLMLNGASGSSADLLRKTLHYGGDLKAINDDNKLLLTMLSGSQFKSANAVWVNGTFAWKPSFEEAVKDAYGATVYNGKSFGPEVVAEINDWAKAKTDGLIPTIVDGLPPAECYVIALNAIGFDGKWKHEFDKGQTADRDFTTTVGAKISVPMMTQNEELDYGELEGAKVLRMPYRDGSFSFVAILPKKGETATKLLASLSAKRYDQMRGTLQSHDVRVTIPRFEFRTSTNLNDAMKLMGLEPLYSNLDLSGMSDGLGKVFLSLVLQKCYIRVDEEGTKAVAVTEAAATGSASYGPAEFTADRPFVFVIEHTSSGLPVFFGAVNDPRG